MKANESIFLPFLCREPLRDVSRHLQGGETEVQVVVEGGGDVQVLFPSAG